MYVDYLYMAYYPLFALMRSCVWHISELNFLFLVLDTKEASIRYSQGCIDSFGEEGMQLSISTVETAKYFHCC